MYLQTSLDSLQTYIKERPIPMDPNATLEYFKGEVDDKHKATYASAVGALIWAANVTRPDIDMRLLIWLDTHPIQGPNISWFCCIFSDTSRRLSASPCTITIVVEKSFQPPVIQISQVVLLIHDPITGMSQDGFGIDDDDSSIRAWSQRLWHRACMYVLISR